MRNRVIQLVPALLAFAGVGFDYISNWCIFTTRACYGTTISHIASGFTQPLYFFSLYSISLAIILIFVRRDIFNLWLRFAAWSLPILIIGIATTPEYVGGYLNFGTDRDDVAQISAQVFTYLSIAFILLTVAFIRHRNRDSERLGLTGSGDMAEDFELLWWSRLSLISLIASIISFFTLPDLLFSNTSSALFESLLAGSLIATVYGWVRVIVMYRRRESQSSLRPKPKQALYTLSAPTVFFVGAMFAYFIV